MSLKCPVCQGARFDNSRGVFATSDDPTLIPTVHYGEPKGTLQTSVPIQATVCLSCGCVLPFVDLREWARVFPPPEGTPGAATGTGTPASPPADGAATPPPLPGAAPVDPASFPLDAEGFPDVPSADDWQPEDQPDQDEPPHPNETSKYAS